MSDKKTPIVEPRPKTSGTASSSSIVNAKDEYEFSADLERGSVCLSEPHDVESQIQVVDASKAPQASDTSGSSNKSLEMVVKTAPPVKSKWRWIGDKELVTSRKPPPSPSGSATKLGSEVKSPSLEAVEGEEAVEKGVLTRGATEGIQSSVESGGEGVAAPPPTANNPPLPPPPPPPPPKEKRSFMVAAAAAVAGAAATGGKKRKVSSVVEEPSSAGLHQDLEKGAVSNDASVGGVTAAAVADHEDDEEERLCRVCHQSTVSVRKADVIDLGCACKFDMGRVHRECAETWFQVRGNRQCEICGETAQNVRLLEPVNNLDGGGNNADTTITVVTVHHRSPCWQNRPIRNFLLVFLVAAFLIPWLFRFAYYS